MSLSNYIAAKNKYLDLQYFRVVVLVTVLKIIKYLIILNENI